MAKRNQEPLRVEAYVNIGGKEVNIDTLPPEQRREIGTQLALTYFNELYRGRAVFTRKQ